jgi:hypothetical protein
LKCCSRRLTERCPAVNCCGKCFPTARRPSVPIAADPDGPCTICPDSRSRPRVPHNRGCPELRH